MLQTQEERNHLIQLAKPTMVKSTVVDSATGKSKDSRSVYLLLIIFSVVHFICIKVPFQ